MKYFSLLFCVTLFAVTAPVPSARADVSVPVDFFYDALSPYGDWVYTDNYGYVWQPAVAQQPGWSPYADGYWAYTDAGWTWISNEDFGWATYHYGRWIRMVGNWFWVPGYEWAPAWVSWRQSDNYVGWAPLPPEAAWTSTIGFSSWTDSYYDIGPSYYNFVPMRSFATSSSLLPFIVDRRQNVTYIDRSVNITNIQYRQNVVNNIFVGGPDPARFDRLGPNHVRRLTLLRDEDDFRRNWLDNRDRRGPGGRGDFNSLSRIENNQLVVAAPSVRRENAPALPPRVRERLERPEVDRGWRNIGDASLAERLRDRQREELAKARDGRLPEKTPTIVTSKEAPPAVGRPLRPEERQLVQRPEPDRVDEEVRKAERPTGTPKAPGVVDQPPSRPGAPGSASTPRGTSIPGTADSTTGPGSKSAEADGSRMEGRPRPGGVPGERGRPTRPGERGRSEEGLGTGPRGNEFRPVPRGVVPNEGGDRRRGGRPSDPEQSPTSPQPRISPNDRSIDGSADGLRPQPPDALTPPRTPAIPMPEARPETRVRPAPMPQPEAPRLKPAPMPRVEPGPQSTPAFPDRELQSRPPLPQRASPQARPSLPERASPQARPSLPDRPVPDTRPFQPERPTPQARPEIPRPSMPRMQSQPPAQPQGRPSGPPQSQGGPGHGGPGRGGPGHGGRDR